MRPSRKGIKLGGRPGRHTAYEEKLFIPAVQLSIKAFMDFMNSDEYTIKEKAEMGVKVMIKAMPAEPLVKVGGDGGNTYVHIYRPEPYGTEVLETASRSPDRSV
jgi:hypothetical protein